jgi:phosphotransferase system enzyme I (PtsI)
MGKRMINPKFSPHCLSISTRNGMIRTNRLLLTNRRFRPALAFPFTFLYSFINEMKTFTGIPASSGIAVAKAFVHREDEHQDIPHYRITEADVPAEWDRLKKAIGEAAAEMKELHANARALMDKEQSDIFNAHLLMLEDEDFHEQLKERMQQSLCNIDWVVWEVSQEVSAMLLQSGDKVFQERAVDIADVSQRVIGCLLRIKRGSPLASFEEDVILVARDLMPSDMLAIDKSKVNGIALDEGSTTCHTAILARAFNLPAVLGLSGFSQEARSGQMLALDGTSGMVIVEPDNKALARQENEKAIQIKKAKQLEALRDMPAETIDGHHVALMANIGLPEEAEKALDCGADGIGLYRSEFLYMASGDSADEEAQCSAYSHVFKTMGKRPVTIRTADVGGDKVFPGFLAASEKNPMMGWRAIRLSIANPAFFKVQLRAILRSSVNGNARIMFPMISGIEELEQAHALLDEARSECIKKGQPFSDPIEVGVMIEVPSAAMTADILAEKSGFFSIGTNDLTQYSLAVDRGNEKVRYLGDPLHPAVLRLVKKTIDAAHEKGIKAAMCGELAGNALATGILLGLGLDEFSMAASSIPRIKELIRKTKFESCKKLADQALRCRSTAEIYAVAQTWMKDNASA